MRVLLAALLLLATIPALAHSFYDYDCCSDNDCAPLPDGAVVEGPNGYEVDMNGNHYSVAYGDPRIRGSADRNFHGCEFPKGQLRCLYTPGRGV